MKKYVGNWDQRKDVENNENMMEYILRSNIYAKSIVMLNGEISRNMVVFFYKELHQ